MKYLARVRKPFWLDSQPKRHAATAAVANSKKFGETARDMAGVVAFFTEGETGRAEMKHTRKTMSLCCPGKSSEVGMRLGYSVRVWGELFLAEAFITLEAAPAFIFLAYSVHWLVAYSSLFIMITFAG